MCGFPAIEARVNHRALSTIRRRLATIRLWHIASNLPSPHEAKVVGLLLKGIAKEQRGTRAVRKAMPVLDADIKRMVEAMDLSLMKGLRDRALLLVGFDGAFRRSELVRLTLEIIEKRPEGLLIELPFSKADQQAKGQIIAISTSPGSAYCPVNALNEWLAASQCKSGLIFKRMHKGNKVGDAGLSAQTVSWIVKESLERIGFDKD